MFEKLQNALNKLGSLMYVRNPLLLFATIAAILGLELHNAIEGLVQTKIIGFGVVIIIAYLFKAIIDTVGRLTEKTPAHLYDDVELLKETLNSPKTLREVVGAFYAADPTRQHMPRLRAGDSPDDLDKYLRARERYSGN